MGQAALPGFYTGALELPSHEQVESIRHPTSLAVRHGIILPGSTRLDVGQPAVSPFNAVALIKLFRPGIPTSIVTGTGFLCRQNVLLTAKHVAAAFQPGDRAGIWLGFDQQRNPAVPALSVTGSSVHPNSDLAVVFLSPPQTNYFELGTPPPPHGAPVMLGGYGIDYSNGATRLSWGSGRVNALQLSTSSIAYLISTRPGDSGAPVFIMDGTVPRAVALHTGAADDPALGNTGIYFSPEVIAFIDQTIQAHPNLTGSAV